MKNVVMIDENAINNVVANPQTRKTIYGIYGILGVVIGSIQVGLSVYGVEAIWMDAAISVYAYLGLPVGALAFTNSPDKDAQKTTTLTDSQVENLI